MTRTDLVLVWLERAIDGSAAGHHLEGTLARLRGVDAFNVLQVIADTHSPDGTERPVRKIRRLVRLIVAGIRSARPRRVLLARNHPLIAPLVIAWRLVGGKVVLSVQGSLDDAGSNNYRALADSRVYRLVAKTGPRLAHGLIAGAPVLEPHIRDEMLGRGAMYANIPNGVFVDKIGRGRNTSRPYADPYVVFVGTLASWQGIETMVLATESLTWPSALKLVVVGDGPERGVRGDSDRVLWLGQLPAEQAHRWLAHAYCAISLKRSDTAVGRHGYWPFKLIESAAAAVPIIVSDAPGMAEGANLLGHAIVVPSQDAEAAAVAVAELWADPHRRDRLASEGLLAAQRFDWTANAGLLKEFLQRIVAQPGR